MRDRRSARPRRRPPAPRRPPPLRRRRLHAGQVVRLRVAVRDLGYAVVASRAAVDVPTVLRALAGGHLEQRAWGKLCGFLREHRAP